MMRECALTNVVSTKPRLLEVQIRRFCVEDIPRLFDAAWESIPELCSWMVWCHPRYSLADSRAFVCRSETRWQQGEQYSFAITDRGDGAFLGSVGLSRVDRTHRVANLGYWVRTSCTGQGVATLAVQLAARFGLQELGLNRLELMVAAENWASRRVAEKVGAKREGVLRKSLLLAGRSCDAVMYSLIAEDLEDWLWDRGAG